MSNHPIPIVDFTPFLDGSAKQQAADQLIGSFKSAGFVYLTNFGIPEGEVAKMFDWLKRFFALPHETKMLAPHPDSGMHHRGYSYPCQEKVTQYSDSGDEFTIALPNMKESFDCGSEHNDSMPNIWLPEGVLPGFNEACLSFFWKCHEVEQNILRALALGFGLEEEWFLRYHETVNNQLRLHHYPSISSELLETNKLTRISAHTDFDTLTFLFQGEIGGLEVEDPNEPGKYVAVTPIPNSVVLNAGDFLRRWSNDTIRSTMHRVVAPPGVVAKDGLLPSRYSMPYFCAPDMSMIIDAIPGTWSADQPKKYEPVSVKEYVMKRFAANY
ncbi:Clavaminate synthase-like protein [Suillus subalutaceus]|uniref:Clavaminate synthase-like protein n=1 Tax=Suillus subalutaceus TaxID=48586 RepID=UPI001B875E32|nr:Clavaminate synthase-like protein [Suillus subalutaceus]KAG1869379.1 Clavaminate synthase-like protein [Suillus subalutaceus]